ncbi:MAG: APC family permease [Micrococcus sp.]|nr:APC family permease [Micrococcus sp.]
MSSTTAPTPPGPSAPVQERLAARRLGVASLVFMIIAASAPLTVVAGGVPSNLAVTGSLGVPLSFVVLGILLLLFSVGYAAMSRHVHNAGAFFAYIAKGLGKPAGVGASLVALVAYNCMQVGIAGMFGFVLSSLLDGLAGIQIAWWVCALLGWAVVGILGVNRIDLNAKVIGVIVALEFVVVIIFNVMGLSVAPEGVTADSLLPEQLFTAGLGAVLVFSIAAFMGFESGAIYNEEVKDPKTTAGRATVIAICLIAAFYAFSAWVVVISEGPNQIIERTQEYGPDLMFVFFAEHAAGWWVDLANLLFLTSLIAAMLAFHNIVARYVFSLGRERILPEALARTSARTGAPIAGSLTQTVLSLAVLLIFAAAGAGSQDPLFPVVTLFTWFTNMGAFGLVLLMALTSLAVLGYLRRFRGEYSVFTRLIAPGLAAAGLVVLFILVILNFEVLIGEDGSLLAWLLPLIVVAPGALGTAWALWKRSADPQAYARIAAGGELD